MGATFVAELVAAVEVTSLAAWTDVYIAQEQEFGAWTLSSE